MSRAFRVNGHKLDQPLIPTLHRIHVIQRLNLRIATLDLCKLLFKLVHQDRIGMLVFLQKVMQQIELVTAEPHRFLGDGELAGHGAGEFRRVVHKTRRHLLELVSHHGRVSRHRLGVREVHHEVALHRLIRLTIVDLAAQLDNMTRRQFVLVVARLQ